MKTEYICECLTKGKSQTAEKFTSFSEMTASVNAGKIFESVFITGCCEEIPDRCFANMTGLTCVRFAKDSRITRIGEKAFEGCDNLTEIEFPASVEEIGAECFKPVFSFQHPCNDMRKKSSLVRVIFHSGSVLKRIGKEAFSGCKELQDIEIPASVEEICEICFYECSSLSRVTFGNGSVLKRIGKEAFCNCGQLGEIEIPASVEEIGESCFGYCNIESLKFTGENKFFTVMNQLLICKQSMRVISCFQDVSELEIPACIVEIGENCFRCPSLSRVTFASGSALKRIANRAFSAGSLKEIELPASLEEIGDYCFFGENSSASLSRVTFASGSALKRIGQHAFEHSDLREIIIPASVEVIGESCFNNCWLEVITFEKPSHLKILEREALGNCSRLTEIEIPASVEEIGDECFGADTFDGCCELVSVTFEEGSRLKRIGNSAFTCCFALKEITLPASLEEVQSCVFAYSSITTITFAEGSRLTKVDDGFLCDCDELQSVVNLPEECGYYWDTETRSLKALK